MSEAEFFCPKSADFLIATEQEPRFNLRGLKDFAEGKDAAAIIAANALRTHQNISVIGFANVFDGLFMNCVKMCYEHDGSLSVDKNEITFTNERFAFEFFGEPLEKLRLRGAKEIFQILHAGTSSARQLRQSSFTIESLWKNFSHSEHCV